MGLDKYRWHDHVMLSVSEHQAVASLLSHLLGTAYNVAEDVVFLWGRGPTKSHQYWCDIADARICFPGPIVWVNRVSVSMLWNLLTDADPMWRSRILHPKGLDLETDVIMGFLHELVVEHLGTWCNLTKYVNGVL